MSDKIAAEVGTALHHLSHAIAAPVDSLLAGIEALKGERDEALAEVERLRGAVDDATHFYHQALEERDEYRAEVERLRKEAREWEYAAVENGKHLARLSDEIDRAEAERDEALAAIERVRGLVTWTDPKRCGGEPCVRGTRVPVELVTDLIEDGCTDGEIMGIYSTVNDYQVAILRALDGGDQPQCTVTVGSRVTTGTGRHSPNYVGTVVEIMPTYRVRLDSGGHETVPADGLRALDGGDPR